jgi:hypothetical protein
MRSPAKGNAACWDCVFYLVINGVRICTATGQHVPITIMPMKCEKREKVKHDQR